MSIIMDMCEGFATKDDVQSSVSMLVAGTSGARLAGLENVCDEISRRLHTLEKAQQVEGSRLAVRTVYSNSTVLSCIALFTVCVNLALLAVGGSPTSTSYWCSAGFAVTDQLAEPSVRSGDGHRAAWGERTSCAKQTHGGDRGAHCLSSAALSTALSDYACLADCAIHICSCRVRVLCAQARVRREQKKLKEDMERLADTTTEHLRLARRRPSSSTSEEGWQGEASNTRKHKKSLQQLDTEEIETAARVAAEAAITLISERVENLETALRDFSPLELVGQLETSREQIDHLTSEMQVLQRLQKGDSSMVGHMHHGCMSYARLRNCADLGGCCYCFGKVRALRLLQKLMSQPDPTAIFAEFDTDGDKQVCFSCIS